MALGRFSVLARRMGSRIGKPFVTAGSWVVRTWSGWSWRRRIVLLVLVLGVVGWRVWAASQPKFTVEVTQVQKTDLVNTVSGSGEVKADEAVDLTFQTSGKLVWVGVKEGDTVRKYQGIASLDRRQLEFNLRKLLNNFENEFTLFDDKNYEVRDEVLTDEVRRIKKRAQLGLDQTVLDVEIQNVVIELATISTPIAGVVTGANPVVAGGNVTPGSAVYSIVNPQTVYFEAEANEVDVPQIELGQKVKVKLDAYPDEEFDGEVKQVGFASVVTSTGGTAYKVRVSLPANDKLKFKLGMSGDAEFVLETKAGVMTLPLTAVVEGEGGKDYVWTVADGKLKRVEVTTGTASVDEIEIVSGLDEEEKVVVRPSTKMQEGDKVKVS